MMSEKYIFSTSSTASDLSKKFKEAKGREQRGQADTRISVTVLANFSTQYLVQSLYASLVFNGVCPNIYEASFDQWEFELTNPESETHRRRSDYVVILLSSTRLIFDGGKTATEFAAHLRSLLASYKERCRGEVILVLPESVREGFDQTSFFHRAVRSLRRELRQELEGSVHFVDIDPLVMEFGFERWHPSKFLVNAKLCCHPNCFPLYGNYLASFIQSLVRRPTRLIITDLDDTLWQGVVGDLGWDGVGLDKDSTGLPYIMLQHYLKSLKEAGVLLAVCSKNSLETVRKVFENRREMVLQFDDFVAHEVTWNPKSEGIGRILADLNLTSTGVMFLDDAKFEREEVKNTFPELIVPELPENPELWCEALSKSGYLTIGKISDADQRKASMYAAEQRRKADSAGHADYSQFVKGLNLTVTPAKVSATNFDRVFELIHKTNQFNLTTKRLTRSELEEVASSQDYFCYCYRLADKYSDYGIISVFIAEQTATHWEIHTWLLSCRAFGRGVENFVFDHFLSTRMADGNTIVGEYIATEKNKPVERLLETMGFTRDPESDVCSFTVGLNTNPKVAYIDMIDARA